MRSSLTKCHFQRSSLIFRLKHANKDIIVVRVKPASTDEGHADDLLEIIRMLKARSRLGVVQEMKHTRVKVRD